MPVACPTCGLLNSDNAERCDCGYDFSSKTMQTTFLEKPPRQPPQGIGGWLILPAIGLVISPILVAIAVMRNMELLTGATVESLETSFPGFRNALVGETILGVGFFIFQIMVGLSFFNRKPFLPRLMVAYLLVNLLLALVSALWLASIMPEYQDWTDVGRGVVVAAIWIPYFLISKRVKNTFARTYVSGLHLTPPDKPPLPAKQESN